MTMKEKEGAGNTYIVAASSLNLRKGVGTTEEILVAIQKGTEVEESGAV